MTKILEPIVGQHLMSFPENSPAPAANTPTPASNKKLAAPANKEGQKPKALLPKKANR